MTKTSVTKERPSIFAFYARADFTCDAKIHKFLLKKEYFIMEEIITKKRI